MDPRTPVDDRSAARSPARAVAALLALLTVGAGLVSSACRPDSVTGARDRLAGEEARTVSYRLPLSREAYGALDFLRATSTVTLEGGLISVPVLPDTVRALVGDALREDGRADVEAVKTLAPASLDLDELAPAVAAATVRTAPIEITLSHTSAAAVTLLDPTLVLARTGPDGEPVRDESGRIVPETDDSGDPLSVPVADSVVVPPDERVELEPEGASLVDRMADLLVGGDPAAVALLGTARVSEEGQSLVETDDLVSLAHRALVGLDLVLPDTGVVLRRDRAGDGLGLAARDADQISRRVVRAGSRMVVRNGVPFRVRVDLAYLGGRDPDADPFAAGDGVVLDSLVVGGRSPDGEAATDTLELGASGEELRPLLEEVFTAAVRIRLLPRQGSDGGGALRVGDLVDVDARVFMEVRSGGSDRGAGGDGGGS